MKNSYKTKQWSVMLIIAFMTSLSSFAQTANSYGFSTFTGTFTPLVGSTATSLTATADEAVSTAFPIGFSFTYCGTVYTTVQATSNGVLLFGSGKTNSFTNNLATTTASQRPGVTALWDDMQCTAGVRYLLSGTSPNQVLTVEWLNMEWNFGSNSPVISNQVMLYETTNIIEFLYRQEATAVASGSASIGIMGPVSTDFISLTGTGASPATSTSTSTNTLNTKPATGQGYRFTPPVPCSGTPLGGTTPSLVTICAGGTTTLTATGATAGPGISYQWQVATVSGGPYVNVTGGTGATTTSYTTGVLTAGTYYYVLNVTCSAGPTSAFSTEATVTVNTLPSVTVTPTSGGLCSVGGSPVALTASGASTYTWTPTTGLTPSTGANVNASPSTSTTYTVTGTDGSGCTGTATSTITVTQTPVISSVTATPSSVCSGGNSQLLATTVPTPVNLYAFSTGTGATLDPMTGATQVLNSANDDTPTAAPAAIGFTFNFNGTSYTQFSVSPDGWLLLGGATAVAQFTNAVTSATNIPKIYPYWDDMATGTTGNVRTLVTGTAPNRIFKVQWFVTAPRATGGPANSTFQAWLYETTGVVEFRYGTMGAAGSSSIGLTGGTTNFQSVTLTTNVASTTTANDANAGFPASGRIYTFTPPSPTYLWTPATFLSSTTIANPMANGVTATTTYTVEATNGTCTSTSTVTITAGSALTSSSTVSPAGTVCEGTTVTFNSLPVGGGAPYTYAWVGPNSFSSTLQNPTLATTVSAAGTYSVTVTDACGATSSSTVSLAVNPAPAVAVSPTSATLCMPGAAAVSLTASGAASFTWGPAAGLSATTGSSVNALPTTSTTYTVTGTDGIGCTATATAVISVNQTPVISGVTATPPNVCVGGNSQLFAAAAIPTPVNAYAFSTGTGATLDPMTGATNVLGTSNDDTPTAAPAAIGFPFNFNGTTYTQYSVSPDGWILLGGATAVNQFTNAVASATNIPKIYPYWDDLATGTTGNVKTLVTGTAPDRIFKVQWFVTSPRATGGPANSTFQAWLYEASGVVEFRYGTMGAAGSSSVGLTGGTTNFQSVTLTTNTSSTTAANNANAGAPASGRIYTFTPPSPTYLWTPPTFLSSTTISNPMANGVTTTTTYTVEVANGVCTSTSSVTVTAGALLTSTSSISPSATACEGSTVTFNSVPAGGGAPYTYAWSGPNGFTSTLQNPTLVTSAAAAGTYTVTVTDDCASTTTSTVTLTINALPLVSVTPSTGSYCNPGGTAVSLSASGATSYAWLPATGLSSASGANVDASPTVTTTYTVSGTDGNGCVSTATAAITVNANPTLTATATPSVVCEGGNSALLATANVPASYTMSTPAFSTMPCGSNPGPTGDDNVQVGNAIGFSFDYFGTTYTQFGISTNGNIQLGNGSGTAGNPTYSAAFTDVAIPNTALPNNMVALAWDDWSISAGQITWGVTGTAPNRSLVVCYNTTGRGGGSADTLNGQIVLEETTNNVRLNITKKGVQPANTSTQGIENQTGTTGSVAVTGRNNTAWSANNSSVVFSPVITSYSYAWSPATFLTSTTVANPSANAMTSSQTYTVVATTSAGCAVSASVPVTVNPNPVATATTTPILCNGGTSTVTVSATGGTPAYTGEGSFTAPAGPYSYTVTDVNGCSSTATGTITEPTPVMVTFTQSPVMCAGGSSSVVISATGGTGTLSGTGTFSQTAGTTVYTVTDANGCTGTASVTVTEPTPVVVTASAGTIACFGGSASVTISATGGTGALTGTGTFSQSVGTTVYTVTDANGCTGTASVTLTEPTLLTASSVVTTPIACNGGAGTVTVSASGGTAGYTGTGSFSQTEAAGTVVYTVTDNNGCTATTSIALTEPTAIVVSYSETGVMCNGGSSSVTINATGGTGPYQAPFASGTNTFAQSASTVVYTVTDANGCTGTASVTVTEPAVLTASSTVTGSIVCNGDTAAVVVNGTGGTTPYVSTSVGTFSQGAGTTVYTVTDANGCTATTSQSLTEPSAVIVSTSFAPLMCNGDSTLVTVTATGGTGAYAGDTTVYQSAGTVTYTVTDANGCIGAMNQTITEPALIATAQSFNFCGSGSVTVGSNTYTSAGTYTDVLTAANTCDSVVTTTVTVTTVDVTTTTSGATITSNSATGTYQWINCGTMVDISGETSQAYTATADGSYAVEVTDNGCVDTSACVMIIGAGIADVTSNTVSVYPNPTMGAFNITITNANIAELVITVVDIQGKEVFTSKDKNVNGSFNKAINIEDISKGLYYIKINTGSEVKMQKLIVQ